MVTYSWRWDTLQLVSKESVCATMLFMPPFLASQAWVAFDDFKILVFICRVYWAGRTWPQGSILGRYIFLRIDLGKTGNKAWAITTSLSYSIFSILSWMLNSQFNAPQKCYVGFRQLKELQTTSIQLVHFLSKWVDNLPIFVRSLHFILPNILSSSNYSI